MNKIAKSEAATTFEQLRGTESEVKALRSMTQRMVLTQHEMVSGHSCMNHAMNDCSVLLMSPTVAF